MPIAAREAEQGVARPAIGHVAFWPDGRRGRGRRRRRNQAGREQGIVYGAGNHHSGMHGSEGARATGLSLYEHPEQEEPADAESSRKKEIQSVPKAAYPPSRNEVTSHATQDSQTPFRFPPRQPDDAAPANRHRH